MADWLRSTGFSVRGWGFCGDWRRGGVWAIAEAVRRKMPNSDIQSIHETDLAGLLDQPLLAALDMQQRTLLTRDVNSIPDFLKERLREGKTHGDGALAHRAASRALNPRGGVRWSVMHPP